MVDRYTTIVYYITRARHKRAHKHNKCDSGVVGNARPCQGRDRGFEPRLSLFIKRYLSWISLFRYRSAAEPLTRGAEQFINTTVLSGIVKLFKKNFKITVDRCSTIVYYITRARHKRAHKHNKCDSGVVGNARPCQGRDRGFEPRLSLL